MDASTKRKLTNRFIAAGLRHLLAKAEAEAEGQAEREKSSKWTFDHKGEFDPKMCKTSGCSGVMHKCMTKNADQGYSGSQQAGGDMEMSERGDSKADLGPGAGSKEKIDWKAMGAEHDAGKHNAAPNSKCYACDYGAARDVKKADSVKPWSPETRDFHPETCQACGQNKGNPEHLKAKRQGQKCPGPTEKDVKKADGVPGAPRAPGAKMQKSQPMGGRTAALQTAAKRRLTVAKDKIQGMKDRGEKPPGWGVLAVDKKFAPVNEAASRSQDVDRNRSYAMAPKRPDSMQKAGEVPGQPPAQGTDHHEFTMPQRGEPGWGMARCQHCGERFESELHHPGKKVGEFTSFGAWSKTPSTSYSMPVIARGDTIKKADSDPTKVSGKPAPTSVRANDWKPGTVLPVGAPSKNKLASANLNAAPTASWQKSEPGDKTLAKGTYPGYGAVTPEKIGGTIKALKARAAVRQAGAPPHQQDWQAPVDRAITLRGGGVADPSSTMGVVSAPTQHAGRPQPSKGERALLGIQTNKAWMGNPQGKNPGFPRKAGIDVESRTQRLAHDLNSPRIVVPEREAKQVLGDKVGKLSPGRLRTPDDMAYSEKDGSMKKASPFAPPAGMPKPALNQMKIGDKPAAGNVKKLAQKAKMPKLGALPKNPNVDPLGEDKERTGIQKTEFAPRKGRPSCPECGKPVMTDTTGRMSMHGEGMGKTRKECPGSGKPLKTADQKSKT